MDAAATVSDVECIQAALRQRLVQLQPQLDALATAFRDATPFPHIAIDDFLPIEVAERVLAQFPRPESPVWRKLPTEDQRLKLATNDEQDIPPLLRAVFFELNAGRFLRFLERLTGIDDLVADTKLVGGGLHQILPTGKLAVHIDYSHHPQNGLFRRLNLLIYLNKDWKEEYGGELQLWDPQISKPEARILPVFNRCAIFATSEVSYHGHPAPLACPASMTRKSLSLYYFTKEAPAGKEAVVHNTLFKSRRGDRLHLSNFLIRTASSGLMRDLMPPIAYRVLRRAWNRRFTAK